jgi:alkanesulfonate monooxygenase SsuD/methylene tetrahydromethanopterin reductase-like flavin-dependent oxidoreductase (luciferase family)
VAEGWGLDSLVLLAELATVTRRVTLVAGVVSVWGRSPATIAMGAATLHQASEGRFILGLGTSTRQLVEGWHDVRFAEPAARLREVAADVRALLAGERVTLRAVPTGRPLRLGVPPVPELPIWIAATGARTARVVADLADGWFPLLLRRDECGRLAAEIGKVRAATGPPRPPITVAAGAFAVVDPDVRAARAVAADCVVRYLASMGEIYPRVVAAQGLGAYVEVIRAANPAPGRSPGIVPDEAQILLDEFTAYGDAASVEDQLRRWDGGVDVTMVAIPPGIPWPRIEATLRAAAPR